MRIILSPAKKMRGYDDNELNPLGMPVFISDAEVIRDWLKSKSYAELKKLWGCNDRIAEQNVGRLAGMSLETGLVPEDT